MWSIGAGKFCRLEYADGTQFWLNREGTEVWATWPENSTIEDTATYLLGPVLGRLLRLRGVTCLHASAVAFGEQAVAFVGPAGAGKSTTAAALALRGHAILSDDVVALAERDASFYVHPAYPYLCLWPESVQTIYGSADALPQLSANYEKRCLSLGKQELPFEERPLPLAAIYILGERRGDPAPVVQRHPATAGVPLAGSQHVRDEHCGWQHARKGIRNPGTPGSPCDNPSALRSPGPQPAAGIVPADLR